MFVFVLLFEPGLMLVGVGVHGTFLMAVLVLGVLVGVHGTPVSMLVSVGLAVIMLRHLVSSGSAPSTAG